MTRIRLRTLLTLSTILCCTALNVQAGTYRVFFRDKGPEAFRKGSPLWEATERLHNKRCIDRRLLWQDEGSLFSIEDAPIYSAYKQSVQMRGFQTLLELRWRNYIVVDGPDSLIQRVADLPYVLRVQSTGVPTHVQQIHRTMKSGIPLVRSDQFGKAAAELGCGPLSYGISFNQADMIKAPAMHRLGFLGQSAVLTFLDSGYGWKRHEATKGANVVAEYDFLNLDTVTENQDSDVGSQDFHGSIVFSTVSGWQQDSIIGIAPKSTFFLAKTESIPFERRIEEDAYAAAVEWAESNGTDVVTSSLGYSYFDGPEQAYQFTDFDGKTTITARVVNDAAKRGVLCATAAGNSGPNPQTIITPSDADSVIAVAAANPAGTGVVGFSARGPRGDGKTKPDIAAQGANVVCTDRGSETGIRFANGTSLATPLIAGLGGLLFDAFPEKQAWEIKNALFRTASQANAKDDTIGYGLADVLAAAKFLGPVISRPSTLIVEGPHPRRVRVAVTIVANGAVVGPRLLYKTSPTAEVLSLPMQAHSDSVFFADIPVASLGQEVDVAIQAGSANHPVRTYPSGFRAEWFRYPTSIGVIPCGIDSSVLPADNRVLSNALESTQGVPLTLIGSRLSVQCETSALTHIVIANELGSAVYQSSFGLGSSGDQIVINLEKLSLPVGRYFIRVIQGPRTSSAKYVQPN